MKNVYKRSLLKIDSGQTETEASVSITSGDRINVLADTNKASADLVSLNIEESGNEIHPFMSVEHFNGQIGSVMQRSVELKTNRGGDWTVRLKAPQAVSQDTYVEVIFITQTTDQCE